MIGIITLLIVLSMSLLITRIATVMLVFTGLSKDLARFQSRSAFTCCGFTTTESERIAEHPVRRRIVMVLMILGHGTVVMAISALIPIFIRSDVSITEFLIEVLWLLAGLISIWLLSVSKWIDKELMKVIQWGLTKWTSLDVADYHSLLHLAHGYAVDEIKVVTGDWLAGKSIASLNLLEEGVQILGIHRESGDYIGTPTPSTYIRNGDTLVLYGQQTLLDDLEKRRAGEQGDQAHEKWVKEQQSVILSQTQIDMRRRERTT